VKPHQLIGLPYRLGADPEKHKAGDCLSLVRTVLANYGFTVPKGERDWYRRLRKKDYSIFFEELNRWGVDSPPKLGTIALCKSDDGYGMATFYEEGWLSYQKTLGGLVVIWLPLKALMVEGCYYQRK
jgi:cell wall-associated NlpC family hydrolase